MQVLELNLASRPFKNDTLLWVGFLTGLVLLGWASWWNVQAYTGHRELIASVHESNTSMRERFARIDLRGKAAVKEIEGYDLNQLRLRSDKANEVIRWKSFSWTKLFNHLEQVQPWDVQMTSVRPVFRSRVGRERSIDDLEQVPVSVEGVARDVKEFFKLQRALIFDPHFNRVDPEGINTDRNSGETVFRMRFFYDPHAELPAQEEILVADVAQEPGVGQGPPASAEVAEVAETAETETKPAATLAEALEDPTDELASDDTLERIPRRGRRADAAAEEESP